MKEVDLNQIERYIAGLSDDNEKARVESQFLNGPDHEILRRALQKSWDSIPEEQPSNVNLDHILRQIHCDINRRKDIIKPSVLRRFTGGYMKVAAVLFLPLLLSAGFFFNKLHHSVTPAPANQQVASTIFAPMGSRVSFSLPDGTTGMLNSGSKLSYSLPFTNKRMVSLEGEAWFDVQKDEEHPFILNTGNSTVKVLGTSFNVNAYPAENYVEVVLKEGKVEFMDNQGDEVAMRPSERLVYRNGSVGKTKADPAKYQAWTKGRMVFNNDPMAEVARRIERWYNVKVVLADRELEKYSFRGTFEDDKLDEVFRLLSLTSPISYKITPRTLHADGSYEKEIVTIHLIKR